MTKRKTAKVQAGWWKYRLPLKFFWPILIILFLFFALSIFNLLSLWSLRQELSSNLEEAKADFGFQANTSFQTDTGFQEEIEVGKFGLTNVRHLELSVAAGGEAGAPIISPEIVPVETITESPLISSASEQLLDGDLVSFGDIFSGLAYIDESQTDMFWDENMTAFTFLPLYEVRKQNDCSSVDCGLSREASDLQSICLSAGCLRKTADLELFFNDQKLQLPPPLNEETLSSITLFSLGNAWLIGLVSGPESAERGWVYRFDGLSFSPLITRDTDFQIAPRFQRGGGRIAFGGDDADFLVLYAGYDGRAFRFRGSSQEDVSKFFGLRITDGGFWPQILKIGTGKDSIFYVCSLTKDKPKIIKIWSKDDLNSGGALDFSYLFFQGNWRPDSILCGISDTASKRLAVASENNGVYSLWLASDLGFDNSRTRQVTSLNLNRQNQAIVKAAVLADVGIESLSSLFGGGVEFFLANKQGNFEKTDPFLWHGFESADNELYWRLEASPDSNKYYSPWLGHINRLDYLLLGR